MGRVYAVAKISDATIRALNYAPEVDRFRAAPKRKRAGWTQPPLGELVDQLGKAYAKVLTRIDCIDNGDELLSQADLFSAEPIGRRIRGELMTFVEDLRIRRGDVLIAGAGQMGEATLFGRSIVADGRFAGKLAAGDLMMLRFAEPDADRSLYVAAFLATAAGIRGIRSTAYGTSIPRMRPDLLAALPVPLPDERVQAQVGALMRECIRQRESYLRELLAARAIVESLPEMKIAHAMCATRKSRAVAWDGELPTLRGWTYASSGGALALLRKEWAGRLGDALEDDGAFHGGLRQRTPCTAPHGVALFSQRDVFAIRRLPRRIKHPGCDDRNLFVPPFSLLVASRGQLSDGALFGRVELGDTFPTRSAITQDILRLIPKKPLLGVAYAYLGSNVGQVLLRSAAVGTSIPILRLDLVKALPFPDLTDAAMRRVSESVTRAVNARNAADAAEERASQVIEGEVLSAWLA